MVAIRYLVKIPEKREITVAVPPHIKPNQMAEVILMVKDHPQNYAANVQAMKAAASDDLFMRDLKEVATDSQAVDSGDWAPPP